MLLRCRSCTSAGVTSAGWLAVPLHHSCCFDLYRDRCILSNLGICTDRVLSNASQFPHDYHKAATQQIRFLSLVVHEVDTSPVNYHDADSDRDWAANQMLPPALRLELLDQCSNLPDSQIFSDNRSTARFQSSTASRSPGFAWHRDLHCCLSRHQLGSAWPPRASGS